MKPVDVAFILAAGRGERLRPLTDKIPKPLLPYRDRPLLDHILDALKPLKLKRVVFNAWHLREQVQEWAEERSGKFDFEILLSLEDELLGTAGGLKKAMPLIQSKEFLMLNGDCLWKGDIEGFCEKAQLSGATSTWWLTSVQRDQTVIGVRDPEVVQIGSLWKKAEPEQTGCFTGIQWIQNLEVEKLPRKGCILRSFLIPQLDQKALRLNADFQNLSSWTDIGTVERYQQLSD